MHILALWYRVRSPEPGQRSCWQCFFYATSWSIALSKTIQYEPSLRGWKVTFDNETMPFSSIYCDHDVVQLVKDLTKSKQKLPAVMETHERMNPNDKRERMNPNDKRRIGQEDAGEESTNNDW
jgi:hypothetical protein